MIAGRRISVEGQVVISLSGRLGRRLSALIVATGATWCCFGAGKLSTLPVAPVLTVVDGGTRFSIISPEPIASLDMSLLSASDATTGLPLALNPATPLVRFSTSTVLPNRVVEVIAIVDEKQLTADKKTKSPGPAFTGVMGVFYVTSAGKDSDTLAFQIVRPGVSIIDKPESASLTLLDPAMTVILAKNSRFGICFTAEKVAFSMGTPYVSLLLDAAGAPAGSVPIILGSIPRFLPATGRACVQGTFTAEPPAESIKLTATLVIPYRATYPGAVWKQLSAKIDFVRTAVNLRMGDNANREIRIWLERTRPWTEFQEFTAIAMYTTTPSVSQLPPDKSFPSQLESNEAQPKGPNFPALQASALPDHQIQFKPKIPRGLTNMRGRVVIAPPLVTEETVLHPIFLVKDAWFLRLGAVVLAYSLALTLFMLTTTFRMRTLHEGSRRNLSARLSNFLATRPDLSATDSVVLLRQLLADSAAADRAGEVTIADQDLQAASSRMDTLISNPPPQSTSLGAGTTDIRVAQPASSQIARQWLTLVVADPSKVPPGALATWQIKDSTGRVLSTHFGVNQTSLRYRFLEPGVYSVTLTAPGLASSLTRSVTISGAPVHSKLDRLKALDLLTHGTAFILACLTAYISTATVDTWGTAAEYGALFTSALGISVGTQSIRTVLGAVRG